MDNQKRDPRVSASRRAKITPDQAGLLVYRSRRVPGLRREEASVLAGVSVPHYTRLERGDINGVSDGVLDALARALKVDDAERAQLFDLARVRLPARPPDGPAVTSAARPDAVPVTAGLRARG